MSQAFDFAPLLPANLPPPAVRWAGSAKYNFTGGNNDADQVPVDGLIADAVLKRESRHLATYGLASGPQGYRPLREFLVGKLKRDAGIACTADDILIVSGSLQALDLVNGALLARGDTVICVIHCGSFSKSIAPALRVGFLVAPWEIMSRMLALKTDAGSGALEQMVLAEYCAPHFTTHVPKLRAGLRAKLETLMETLNAQFGTTAEFEDPKGGIFLWVKLPDSVDTMRLHQAPLKQGVAINPGPEWSTDKGHSGSRLRLCFASPTKEQIREGVAILADVCRREFGVPTRIANVQARA
jgi:DNA-binding transcriptional MocR family regulator